MSLFCLGCRKATGEIVVFLRCKDPLWLCFQKAVGKGPRGRRRLGRAGHPGLDLPQELRVVGITSCGTPHTAEIISLVFKLSRKLQADKLSAV